MNIEKYFNPKKSKVIEDQEDENEKANEPKQTQKQSVEKPSMEKPSAQRRLFESQESQHNNESEIPFSILCEAYTKVGDQKGANSKEIMKDIMANVFSLILNQNPKQLVYAYLFSILKLGSQYEQPELGIGQSILVKVINLTTGRTEKQIRDSQNQLGDLGLVVEKSKGSQSTVEKFFVKKVAQVEKRVSLSQVFRTLKDLAYIKGNKSNLEKEKILTGLIRQATPEEAKYIIRFLESNLKIGAAEKTMQTALTKTFYQYIKQSREESFQLSELEMAVNRSLCEFPNYEALIDTLITKQPLPQELLKLCYITPGVPCKPMLAKPMKSIQMILDRFENIKFTCEFKYDGLRGQIHWKDGEVSIYSRNLENMTQTYPDIVRLVRECFGGMESFILDSEIVGFDGASNQILPFQVLATRQKKNVDEGKINVKICLFVFDLLYLNGKSLLQCAFSERRAVLRSTFLENAQVQYAQSMDSDSVDEIQDFLLQSVKIGCEGLMIKTLEVNSEYEPAKRSFKWLKLKKDYLSSGMGDSFDLVPIAALFGVGKRKGLYGSYLLACYNEDLETYETICKIGTGFSDDNLEKFYNDFQDSIIPHPLSEYKCDGLHMDVWFKPRFVWEVKGADLQQSPVYSACQTMGVKGIGLRFPRLIQERKDKNPDQATTSQQIYELYQDQAVVKNQQKNDFKDEDDYY